MDKLAIAALCTAALAVAVSPALAQTPEPSADVTALQQMFATTQAGEFAALREAAQLNVKVKELEAKIKELEAKDNKKAVPDGASK